MIISLKRDQLSKYVISQLDHFFPDGLSSDGIHSCMRSVLERVEYCFSAINDKYFIDGNEARFNHLNSDQYSMFLYFLSNMLYKKEEDVRVCEKVYYLNKLLNCIDVYFEITLPDIFLFSHPVGSVLGRAEYNDYLLVLQNCTIGGNHDVDHPVIGKYVALYKGASILGKCKIGDNCKISADSLIMDKNLSDNEIYIGTPLNYSIKKCRHHDKIWEFNK